MHNRNVVKVRIADTSYYLRNAKYYYKMDLGRCQLYLASVRSYIEETIKLFKRF